MSIDDLKTAAELIEKAAELAQRASSEAFLPSEAVRLAVREEVRKIRVHLIGLRHDLTILRAVANRRKPRKRELAATAGVP